MQILSAEFDEFRQIFTVTLSRYRTFPLLQKGYLHIMVYNKEKLGST